MSSAVVISFEVSSLDLDLEGCSFLILLTNLRTYAVTHSSLVKLLNRSQWIILCGLASDNLACTFTREWTVVGWCLTISFAAVSFIEGDVKCFGHSHSGLRRNSGPFHHNLQLTRSFPLRPRDGKSAGLTGPGQYLQELFVDS